jgi:hypothetical protein
MYSRDSAEWVWLAGFLSARGGFSVITNRAKYSYVRMTLRAPVDDDGLAHAARVMGVSLLNESAKGRNLLVTLQGERLNEVMQRVWPWLSIKRRANYKRQMARVIDRMGYVQASYTNWMEIGPEDHIPVRPRPGDEARALGRARWKTRAEENARAAGSTSGTREDANRALHEYNEKLAEVMGDGGAL